MSPRLARSCSEERNEFLHAEPEGASVSCAGFDEVRQHQEMASSWVQVTHYAHVHTQKVTHAPKYRGGSTNQVKDPCQALSFFQQRLPEVVHVSELLGPAFFDSRCHDCVPIMYQNFAFGIVACNPLPHVLVQGCRPLFSELPCCHVS